MTVHSHLPEARERGFMERYLDSLALHPERLGATDRYLLARYRDATLNDLPEFAGENPSVENFARHVAERVVDDADVSGPESLTVRLWEDETAWAAYETAV